MSKSLGNFFLVREILDKFPAETVRFFLLSTHYRSPLDFDDEKLAAAGRGLERVKTCVRLLKEAAQGVTRENKNEEDYILSSSLDTRRQEFEDAMDDDFNTALATGVMFDAVGDINSYLHRVGPGGSSRDVLAQARILLEKFNSVMGFFRFDSSGKINLDSRVGEGKLVGDLVDLIINIRQEARSRKDWSTSDNIRNGLKDLGIILEDTPQGVRWKR